MRLSVKTSWRLTVRVFQDHTPPALYKRIHTKRHDAEKAATSAWSECAEVIKDHHEGILMRWKEEIDTLLVYVRTLFSRRTPMLTT